MKSKNKIVNNAFDKILNSITPERKAEMDAMMDAHLKWMDEHPDYNERYGTDKSYWLDEKDFNNFDKNNFDIAFDAAHIIKI